MYCLLNRASNKFHLEKAFQDVPFYVLSFTSFTFLGHFVPGDKKFHLATKWRREKINRDKKKSSGEESLGHCFITAMAALCTQGCYIQSHLVSIRILMLFLLLFGMIMCSSYSALLVSQVGSKSPFCFLLENTYLLSLCFIWRYKNFV